MRDHTKLKAFELADELANITYKVTRGFPREKIYGLTSQMKGCARGSQNEYLHFLEIAFGSLRELHYQFGLAKRLGYL